LDLFSLFLAALAMVIILINVFNALVYYWLMFFASVSVLAWVRWGCKVALVFLQYCWSDGLASSWRWEKHGGRCNVFCMVATPNTS